MTANSRQHRKIRQRIAARKQRIRITRPLRDRINWAKLMGNFPDEMGDTVWWLPPPEGGPP